MEDNEYYDNFIRRKEEKERMKQVVKKFDILTDISIQPENVNVCLFSFYKNLSDLIMDFQSLDSFRKGQLIDKIAKFLLNIKKYDKFLVIVKFVSFLIEIEESNYDILENFTLRFEYEEELSLKMFFKGNDLKETKDIRKVASSKKDLLIFFLKDMILVKFKQDKLEEILNKKTLSYSRILNKFSHDDYLNLEEDLVKSGCFRKNMELLEISIRNHIKFTKRNTKIFADSFEKIKNILFSSDLLKVKIKDISIFGSLNQYCYNIKSDLEFSVQIDISEDYPRFLENIKEVLQMHEDYTEIGITCTKRTRLVKVFDNTFKVKIEIALNNILPILNSKLIRLYSCFDKRFIVLNNIIRDWSKVNGLNGNFSGNLSSYCYTLMLIFFLQKGLEIPLLPNFQSEKIFNTKTIVEMKNNEDCIIKYVINYSNEEIERKLLENKDFSLIMKNDMSCAELLIKFFEFYIFSFDRYSYCIDISYDYLLPRCNEIRYLNTYNNMGKINFCIIDPFDFEVNPSSYFSKNKKLDDLREKMYETLIQLVTKGQLFPNENENYY
jgi:DNA polymerase sigma